MVAFKMYLVYCKNLPIIKLILFVSASAINPFENVSVFTTIGEVDFILSCLHPIPMMIKVKTLFGARDLITSWDVSDHLRELASIPSMALSNLETKFINLD